MVKTLENNLGRLAGSARRACDSSQDHEFKPHVGYTDYYKKIKLKKTNKLGNNLIFFLGFVFKLC